MINETEQTNQRPVKYPAFKRAILSLGKDDDERAAALGMSRSTFIQQYKNNAPPRLILRLMRRPETLRALAEDAETQPAFDQAA